ncbi:MAG: leucine-rich repeat-containing protein kinase family protein [Methylococcales bacterium]|nr:leucine-rich repeat-containing protein kinase family protein [Methylococcales bacterium]
MQTIDQLRSGELAGSRHLKLACGLTHFPREIMQLAETLEVLDLSGNALAELPDDLAQLRKLRIIFCSDNQFTALPEVLGACPELSMIGFKANRIRSVPAKALPPQLRWLILTDNQIETLPDEIGNCIQLQKLMLAGNHLQALPDTLAHCKRLELLRIAANRLNELPPWLFSLPRLSWLAYSGNPFGATLESTLLNTAVVDDIPWHRLAIEQLLGEGASGFIHRAHYQPANERASAVAVKLFKGAVTSDGLPQSEMSAAITAGQHPNLIKVLGRVNDHPSGVSGLVMELIDSAFTNLAQPPSLASCTRDIYPAETRFDLPVLLQIAQGVAAAAQHLHSRGIMHGDLYGHNILQCDQGRALMGDFGAASFYVSDDRAMADGLQRLEVRAFGCLLEELLERCNLCPDDVAVLSLLHELKSACLSDASACRPLFDDITVQLIAAMGCVTYDPT